MGGHEGGVQGLVPGMDVGEPSGGPGWEALHAGLGTQACEEGGGSVCLRALLPEADAHLDECGGVGAEGGDRGWEVWGQVWNGEGGKSERWQHRYRLGVASQKAKGGRGRNGMKQAIPQRLHYEILVAAERQ